MGEEGTFRRACRRLLPVSLRASAAAPRLLSSFEELTQRRGATILTLAPPAAPLLLGSHVTLDFELDGVPFTAAARVDEIGADRLRVEVRRGPDRRPPRSPRARPPAGRMVALFVPEGAGLGRCAQPVLDVSLRGLRLQSSFPFAPGTVLRQLTLLHRHAIVRRAEGVVVGAAETIDGRGRRSWECGVRLRAPTHLVTEDDAAQIYELSEPGRVRGILWALCDLSHPVTLHAGTRTVHGRLEPVKGSRDRLPAMRCTLVDAADDAPDLAGALQLECTLYGSGYRFYARLQGKVGPLLMLQPAPVVREWHRRDEERLVLAPGAGQLEFVHPVTGDAATRQVIDASGGGVGLARAAEDELLWPDLPLDQARLVLPGVTVTPTEATVRSLSAERVGITLDGLDEPDRDRLRVALAGLGNKPIELSDGENLDEILRFHEAVRLFEPQMVRNLDAARELTRFQWRLAHQHPDGLMRTALVRWKGGVGATLTLVRGYETGWVLQHSAVASPAVPANPGMLHSLLVRLAIPRPDGEYVCGYIDEEARSQHAVMDAFFHEWSTPEHRGATRFVLWAGDSARHLTSADAPRGARRLRRAEEPLVEHAALRVLDPLCARALGLRPGEVTLPATRAAFARSGLVREREAWARFDRGRCRAVMLREIASPGLCLSSLLSAGLLLPLASRDLEADLAPLINVLLTQPLPGHPPHRFLLAPDGTDERVLGNLGLRRVAGCTLYAMHRYGLQEYHRYVASKYGFLHGRLRARTSTEAA